MTLRSRLLVTIFAILSAPVISSAMEGTSNTAPRIYTATEIAYIRGINCDTFTSTDKTRCLEIKKAALSQSQTGTTLPPPPRETQSGATDIHRPPEHTQTGSEMDRPKPPVSESGTTLPKPPKPPMGTGAITGSGADIEREMKGLALALGQLTPEQRIELRKMIREYLTSKGVTLPTPETQNTDTQRKGGDSSIKGNKATTDTQTERKATLEQAKAKREAMRKNYVGHVTLIKQ